MKRRPRVKSRYQRLRAPGGEVEQRRVEVIRVEIVGKCSGQLETKQRLALAEIDAPDVCPARAKVHEVLDQLTVGDLSTRITVCADRLQVNASRRCHVDVAGLAHDQGVMLRLGVEREFP